MPERSRVLTHDSYGKTKVDEVDKCEHELSEQGNVLGVVLNKCRYMGEQYGYY